MAIAEQPLTSANFKTFWHIPGKPYRMFLQKLIMEKEMATHSSVLAWRIPGTGEPGGLPSLGSHRAGHDWSDLAAAAAMLIIIWNCLAGLYASLFTVSWPAGATRQQGPCLSCSRLDPGTWTMPATGGCFMNVWVDVTFCICSWRMWSSFFIFNVLA